MKIDKRQKMYLK